MTYGSRAASAVVVVLCTGWNASAQTATTDQPEAVKTAVTGLQAESKGVFKFVHPTMTMRKVSFPRWEADGDGHKVSMVFEFKDFLGEQSSEVVFRCDGKGRILSCEVGNYTGIVAPFTAVDAAIAGAKALVTPELKKLQENGKPEHKAMAAAAEEFIRDKDAKSLCVLYLKVKGSGK